jgi:hypothetical protein
VAAAFVNAIYDAIGVRFYELPITPEKILAALRERGEIELGVEARLPAMAAEGSQ